MNTKVLTLIAALTVVGYASAQDQVSAGGRPLRMTQISPNSMGLNSIDRKAMHDIAVTNMLEIKMGQMAMNRGTSDWARQFGKEMVMEHTAAQAELRSLASKKGVSLPQNLPRSKMAMIGKLSKMNGSQFDAFFRQAQLKGHQETEAKLRSAMKLGKDADVRGLEVKLLPSVVMHKRMAMMRQTMMGATKMTGGKA